MGVQFRFLTETLAAPEYNCSAHSPEEWSDLYGDRQYIFGVWSIVIGCVSLMLYTPAISFFSREKRFTCIKIMRVLAIVDLIGIFCAGILFGIQMLQGAVFCSHKSFILVNGLGAYCMLEFERIVGIGTFAACWNVSSCICVFLVVNRILELTGNEHFFQGLRSTLVMTTAFVYGICIVFFIPPTLTNSRHQSMHFCPFIPGFDCSLYVNYPHMVHNSFICISISSLFIIFCAIVKSNTSTFTKSSNLKNMQSRVFTQAAIICLVNVGGSFVWILMNIFPTPQVIITIGMIGYQFIHASPCMIYIALNRNVRNELLRIMPCKPVRRNLKSATTSRVGGTTVATS